MSHIHWVARQKKLEKRIDSQKQSQVRGFTGARLGGVPIGRHFRFGGSQS
jgi:hypothetical protein